VVGVIHAGLGDSLDDVVLAVEGARHMPKNLD
jgi:hypothetical protein